MNEPKEFGDTELEQLLRATFSAEARGQVPDGRAVPPFPEPGRLATVHPLRRRWTGIVLVAAALIGVLVGALVVGEQVMDSQRTPTPAGTTPAPEPTVTPTTGSTTPTPTTATTTASTAVSNPPAGTRSVTVAGVTMNVPTAWSIQPLTAAVTDSDYTRTCFVSGPAKAPTAYDPTRCVLALRVSRPGADAFGADQLDVSFQDICGNDSTNPDFATYAGDQVTVDGQETEHRRWSTVCAQAMIDTWTVPTFPVVQFTRVGPGDAVSLAAARNAVLSARVPQPRSTLRATDVGYPTAVVGSVLSIDRITAFGHTVVDDNHTTYDYPLADGASIMARRTDGTIGTLTPDQLRAEVEGQTPAGFVPAGQLYARVVTDGSRTTQVLLAPRSDLS